MNTMTSSKLTCLSLSYFLIRRKATTVQILTSGLYYKSFTIVIDDCNDSGQYYKTMITIVIYDPSEG